MPILDYLRYTEPNAAADGTARNPADVVRIPSFHTGSLGFIPGVMVFVHLVDWPGRSRPPDDCELYVSPFPPTHMDHFFRLEVILRDTPGVVNRRVEIASSLEINII